MQMQIYYATVHQLHYTTLITVHSTNYNYNYNYSYYYCYSYNYTTLHYTNYITLH